MPNHTWATFLSKRLRRISKITYYSEEVESHSILGKNVATNSDKERKGFKAEETPTSQRPKETNNTKSGFAINSIIQADDILEPIITGNNNDALADDSPDYQLTGKGQIIDAFKRIRFKLSERINPNWDAVKAIQTDSGFQVLLDGAQTKENQFYVYTTNDSGQVTKGSGWKTTAQALTAGWESTYGDIIQIDGVIGNTNDGNATFVIQGTPEVGQPLTVELVDDDPDGNGSFNYTWEASFDTSNWSTIASGSSLTVSQELEGQQVQARISYTDAEEHPESVYTDSVTIARSDDFSEDSSTTGRLSIGGTSSGELEEAGDSDWFQVSLVEGASYEFNQVGNTLSDPYLYLRNQNGTILLGNDDDDDGSGLNSRITFNATYSGSYYLDAGSYQNSLTGSYTVSATETAAPPEPGFSSIDGWGEVSASRAFEQLMGINLPSVDNLGGNLWGLDNINAPEVWAGGTGFSGVTGEGVTVAVIDTGVDLDHPEFTGRITYGYDFVDNDTIADDGHGHGTHVAGTIAGSHNDGVGISGVAPDAQIMPIRVLDDNGSGYTSDIVEGIIWATDNGADVINMSLGGGGYSQAMADAIEYASNNGTVVVMAAGNSSGNSPNYPAAHAVNYGIAVGAVDQSRNMASFSNLAGNTMLDYVTAPGQYIYSSVPSGNYDFLSGTSMAAPHVAGVAALLKSHDNSLSASTIEDLLTGTASNAASANITTTLSESPNSEKSFSSDTIITAETIHQFSEDQLSTRLIGRTASGNAQPNNEFSQQINSYLQSNPTSDTQPFGTQATGFLSVDLTDTSNTTSSSELLSNLLSSNQFEYFEIDSIRTTAQYTNQAKDFRSSSLEPKDELTGETFNPSILSTTIQGSSQTNAVSINTIDNIQKTPTFNTIEIFEVIEEAPIPLSPSQWTEPTDDNNPLIGAQPSEQIETLKTEISLGNI